MTPAKPWGSTDTRTLLSGGATTPGVDGVAAVGRSESSGSAATCPEATVGGALSTVALPGTSVLPQAARTMADASAAARRPSFIF